MKIFSIFAVLLTISYQVYGETLMFHIQAAYIGDVEPGSDEWKNLEDKIDDDPYYLRIKCTRDSGKDYTKDIGNWAYKIENSDEDPLTHIDLEYTFDFGDDHKFDICELTLWENEIWDDEHGNYFITRNDVSDGNAARIDAEFDHPFHVVFTVQLFNN